jgi:hypothetical protein
MWSELLSCDCGTKKQSFHLLPRAATASSPSAQLCRVASPLYSYTRSLHAVVFDLRSRIPLFSSPTMPCSISSPTPTPLFRVRKSRSWMRSMPMSTPRALCICVVPCIFFAALARRGLIVPALINTVGNPNSVGSLTLHSSESVAHVTADDLRVHLRGPWSTSSTRLHHTTTANKLQTLQGSSCIKLPPQTIPSAS